MRTGWVAAATVILSLPLFASYRLKHVLFTTGYLLVVVYTLGLIAVPVVPVLLMVEIALIVVYLRRGATRGLLRMHVAAAAVATLGYAYFLCIRSDG